MTGRMKPALLTSCEGAWVGVGVGVVARVALGVGVVDSHGRVASVSGCSFWAGCSAGSVALVAGACVGCVPGVVPVCSPACACVGCWPLSQAVLTLVQAPSISALNFA